MANSKIKHEIIEQIRAVITGICGAIFTVLQNAGMPVSAGVTTPATGAFMCRMSGARGQIVVVGPHTVFVKPGIPNQRRQTA